jgi:hypothetical protein
MDSLNNVDGGCMLTTPPTTPPDRGNVLATLLGEVSSARKNTTQQGCD